MFIVQSFEGLYLTGSGSWSTNPDRAFKYTAYSFAKLDADSYGGFLTSVE